jgi:hypothetical protein
MKRLLACFFSLLAAFSTPALRAELPPSAYEKMQSDAPEVLRIQVLRVTQQPGSDASTTNVSMLAQVIKVGRTATKLKPGDMITVNYKLVSHPAGWVGPGEVPVLKENAESVAYLKVIEGGEQEYAPAAGAMSFDQF